MAFAKSRFFPRTINLRDPLSEWENYWFDVIWKQKRDWIVEKGGMALLLTHLDYFNFGGKKTHYEEFPAEYYEEFLHYIKSNFNDRYWHVWPRDLTRFWSNCFSKTLE